MDVTKPIQVLAVENNPTILRLLELHLGTAGCEVKTAQDGLEALLILDNWSPDILFTDIIMPKVGGDQLCSIIRSNEKMNDLFIAIHSSTSLEDNRHILNLDADVYLAKGPNQGIKEHVLHVLEQYRSGIRRDQSTIGGAKLHAREITRELLLARKHALAIFNNIAEAVVELDSSGKVVQVNLATEHLLQRSIMDILSRPFFPFLQGEEVEKAKGWLKNIKENRELRYCSDYNTPLKVNDREILLNMVAINEEKDFFVICILQDITRQKETERKLERALAKVSAQAHRDSLTGLPNLRLSHERLLSTIAMARRKNWMAALMFLDLDGFKNVNDTHGHEMGDKVLTLVAKRLEQNLRQSDTAARIGGDEFLIIQSEVPDREAVAIVAQKLIQAISEPMQIDTSEIQVGASIGIAIYPENGEEIKTLMKKADDAMYYTKRIGKNNYTFAPG